jgi:hypothetical protein
MNESRGMPSRNTKTNRHGLSKVSTGWCRKRNLLMLLVLFTAVAEFSQMFFQTFVEDSSHKVLESHLQESLRLMPMHSSKGSKYEAVVGNRTKAVAQQNEHSQESHRLLPMDSSKGSTYEAVGGNGTKAVAQQNERSFAAVNSTLTAGKRQFAKYAYAFVLGGCNPDDESPTYRYFVYNILVSARVLREAGSQADIVAFFQISYQSTYDRLPSEDVRLLEAMNVRIEYIPKSPHENFYRTGE